MEIFRQLAEEGKCVIIVSLSSDVADICDEKYELVKIQKPKSKKPLNKVTG